MGKPLSSKKPARTQKEKEKQFKRIIDEGRKLFVSKGTYGFSTHALAKRLGMVQGNLYNYVKSKRELYIAIRTEDFQKLKNDMIDIVENHEGSYLELINKLLVFYLEFAKKEFRRFQMMFMVPLPPSKKVGPLEKNYRLVDPLQVLRDVVKKAIEKKEVKDFDVDDLTYFLYAIAQGAVFVERDIRYQKKVLEPIELKDKNEKIESFRKFLTEQLIKFISR